MVNAQVGVRVNIMQGSSSGPSVYTETHIVTTNTNGLMTLNIGSGSVLHGNFEGINWADGPYYLKTDIDPNGGNDYTITTIQQLLSVPYALYAKDAGNVPTIPTNISAFTNDAGYLTSQDMPEIPTVPTNVSAFTNDAGYLTNYNETDPQFNAWNKDYNDLINKPNIPTVPENVSAFTNDAGYVTSTEVQQIAEVPSVVSAFQNDAGYITAAQVPAQVNADWDAMTGAAQILNKPTIPTMPTNVSAFVNDVPYLTSFIEQQVLTISNDTIFLTGGSFVKLPAAAVEFSGDYNDLTNTPIIPAEWSILKNYLSCQGQYMCGMFSSYIAKALSDTSGWMPNSGICAIGNNQSVNNATHFSALPAGSYCGNYVDSGYCTYFWSTTEISSNSARCLWLHTNYATVESYSLNKSYGFSVRCLRD